MSDYSRIANPIIFLEDPKYWVSLGELKFISRTKNELYKKFNTSLSFTKASGNPDLRVAKNNLVDLLRNNKITPNSVLEEIVNFLDRFLMSIEIDIFSTILTETPNLNKENKSKFFSLLEEKNKSLYPVKNIGLDDLILLSKREDCAFLLSDLFYICIASRNSRLF